MSLLELIEKIVPLKAMYDDLLSRGFKQFGAQFEDFAKTIRKALPGIQLSAVEQDQFRKLIEDPYFRVASASRTLPPAQLVGQILEGARYEPAGTEIWKMFEALLQRGYDKDREHEAHPAFAGVIRQLSPDEALILTNLRLKPQNLLYQYRNDKSDIELHAPWEDIAAPFPYVHYRRNMHFYAQHLEALGLIGLLILQEGLPVENGRFDSLTPWSYRLQLNVFGASFCKAVTNE